jgi:site-specific recombinase XerD
MTDSIMTTQPVEPQTIKYFVEQSATVDAMRVFFEAQLRCINTRRAYERSAKSFFTYAAEQLALGSIETVKPYHVSAWRDAMLAAGQSAPTVKQRLAALNRLFESLLSQRIISVNPVRLVQGPRHVINKGRTPVLSSEEMVQLLAAIDTTTLIGKRDRAMIGAMVYSFARIGAIVSLNVEHIFYQQRRLWLRLREKGGKAKDVPCHHQLEFYLGEWLDAAGHRLNHGAPLFQTFARSGKRSPGCKTASAEGDAESLRAQSSRPLSGNRMTQSMTWEMLQRRKAAAGLSAAICNHTFRATGITAYLSNGGAIEGAANIAGHASINTTKIYDRRSDEVTLDEIERIRFA